MIVGGLGSLRLECTRRTHSVSCFILYFSYILFLIIYSCYWMFHVVLFIDLFDHRRYVMTIAAESIVANQHAPPQPSTSFLASFMSMSMPFFHSAPLPSYNFINPVSGITYSQHDLMIPLRDVYLIFNNANVSSFIFCFYC